MFRYIICYDISSNSRRRKVAACLDALGDRVQKSVFELRASKTLLQQCLDQIEARINPDVDQVAVYQLCSNCDARRSYLGANESVRSIGEEQVFIA